jgi:DNA replication licensing factor MCM5
MHQRTSGDEYSRQYGKTANVNKTCVQVDLAHVGEYDAALLDLLLRQPATVMPPFETAALDALKTLLYEKNQQDNNDDFNMNTPQNPEQGATQDMENNDPNTNANNSQSNLQDSSFHGSKIQILLKGNLSPTPLRKIQSVHLNTLVRCTGIVISASKVRSRATTVHLRCSRCQHETTVHATSGPFGAILLPQRCLATENQEQDCGPSPYSVVPDNSLFVDQQTLKLQESPEVVPTGEMPRSVLLAVERGVVDKAPPGTRVSIMAIVSLFNATGGGGSGNSVKTVYLRVLGLQRDSGAGELVTFTPREEEAFRRLARRSDVYEILSRSIAPSISGSYTYDIKKALTCQLFSGSRKKLPDGMRLRGDINVLLLGDPSMAKSQFLKYVTRVAPVGVYTSGKGSSAAGLTASVVKDQRGEFYLEGGAMVLADGGIVAIDEFDKMRPADRVAIHEAMEQQTISVAKAGITTVLNSRSSVLAAANPVFGRYDDMKSASENIDLMTTILSRFDLIFLVRDVRDEVLDKMICHHVMGVHIGNSRGDFGSLGANPSLGIGNGTQSDDGGFFDQRER